MYNYTKKRLYKKLETIYGMHIKRYVDSNYEIIQIIIDSNNN